MIKIPTASHNARQVHFDIDLMADSLKNGWNFAQCVRIGGGKTCAKRLLLSALAHGCEGTSTLVLTCRSKQYRRQPIRILGDSAFRDATCRSAQTVSIQSQLSRRRDQFLQVNVRPGAGEDLGGDKSDIRLAFARLEPLVLPKTSLAGINTERMDTRVVQVIYFVDSDCPAVRDGKLLVGQLIDVFVDARMSRGGQPNSAP